MPRMRFYGTICPICKRSIGVGTIELRDGAYLDDLRYKLSQRGWQAKRRRCVDPECNGSKLCGLKDLIFLDLQKLSES